MNLKKEYKPKILIVDDNPISYRLLEWWCKKWGYDYDVATTGKEAMKLLPANVYDIILMDILLPDTNGVELRKEILTQRPLLPVIFQSGYAQHEKIERLNPLDSYLRKPFLPEELHITMDAKLTRPALMQIA